MKVGLAAGVFPPQGDGIGNYANILACELITLYQFCKRSDSARPASWRWSGQVGSWKNIGWNKQFFEGNLQCLV